MSEHLVRVGRLKELQRLRSWSDAELARQCGRKPQQVSAWFKNDPRKISEKLARSLEEALKLPRYWLDEREREPTPPELRVSEAPPSYGSVRGQVQRPSRPVAILAWEQLATMLTAPADKVTKKAPRLDTFAVASPLAKFVEMPDDSMEPVFHQGDHILFDPIEAPHAGDTVLVQLRSGEHFVRTFMPKTAYVFDAVAHNANYVALSSTEDGATVVAVMVEHRRYRRRK